LFVFALFPATTRAQAWTFNHFAGSLSGPGFYDGNGSSARFYSPTGVVIDSAGNAYVADNSNHTIRKITPSGSVTTLAGMARVSGSADGAGSAARFNTPWGIAIDSMNNLYVADYGNHTIRKITPIGVVTTFAGLSGSIGSADGIGNAARFKYPTGVAVDSTGNVYVADAYNCTIRKITSTGSVTTFAGLAGSFGNTDGTGSAARFNYPRGIAVDSNGNVFVADTLNYTIRKITPLAVVSTLAGLAGVQGNVDGTGSTARFNYPQGVAVDTSGILYMVDSFIYTVRRITSAGVVTTIAGLAGSFGSVDGTGNAARFSFLYGIATDSTDNLVVVDTGNHTIRKITPLGGVTTWAGLTGSFGSADGTGSIARFRYPYGLAMDSAGNVYVADTNNYIIRKITSAGVVSTLAGFAGSIGSTDGAGSAARFAFPTGIAVDSAGNLFVADYYNYSIRKITPGGLVTTFAGLSGSFGSADGTGSAARFNTPWGIAIDSTDTLYVADSGNFTIRKITSAGVVTTLAGLAGSSGSVDGTGSNARFYNPNGVAIDSVNNIIYVVDTGNHTIRKITAVGDVTTLAGLAGSTGSADGTGIAARFNTPYGLAVDYTGSIYVADTWNHTIRFITPAGAVSTLAGLALSAGSADGTANTARFQNPFGIAIATSGNVLIVLDSYNHAIRSGTPALADVAVIDAATGCVSAARQIDTSPQTATSWQWRIIRQPSGSVAALSTDTIRNPAFTPDVGDRYEFLLTASGGAASSITTVALNASAAPAIGIQPASLSACVGGSANFSVTAFGATGYQWYNPSGPISGATGSSYTINPVGTGDAGNYYVALTGTCVTTLSDNASLSVPSAPPFSPGNSLIGGKSATVNLNWAAVSGSTSYNVKRCTGACTPATTVATPTASSYSEALDATSYFYAVEAVNACGVTP
jgi:sugar lactone lactonase YvrE